MEAYHITAMNANLQYASDMYTLGNYDPCMHFCQQTVEHLFKHLILQYCAATDDLHHTNNLVSLHTKLCTLLNMENNKVNSYLEMLSSYHKLSYAKVDGNIALQALHFTRETILILSSCESRLKARTVSS